MKKRLALFAATIVMALAFVLPTFSTNAATLMQSCQGKCKRAYNACIATGTNPPSCNAAYQGCISSCK